MTARREINEIAIRKNNQLALALDEYRDARRGLIAAVTDHASAMAAQRAVAPDAYVLTKGEEIMSDVLEDAADLFPGLADQGDES